MTLPTRILVATDLSAASRPALEWGARCARASRGQVLLATVFDPNPFYAAVEVTSVDGTWSQLVAEQKRSIYEELAEYRNELFEGVSCDLLVLFDGSPARALTRLAKEREMDLIVVGAHGRTGLQRLLVGSVAQKVVRLASVPVLVAR